MSSFRLSQDIIPTHYDASFVPDIPKKVYSARLLITFKVQKESDHAELFADPSIKIHSVKQNGSDLKYTHEKSRLHVFFGDIQKSDNSNLFPVEFLFDGSLDHFTMGWYYVNDECCSSQFESSSARLLMPCFDEPCVKSVFKISITAPKHLMALSNMPAMSIITSADGKTRDFTFHPTPPMSCYLLALVVGDFDMKTGFTKRGLPVDVLAPKGKEELMDQPLEEGIYSIEWLEDFLQVNFPLPRLQMVAVPEFQYGAMENFGLLIFRESCFLAKKGITSLRAMYNAAITVIHEIVHQWAGDSTSPKWWNSVWLNEGFASIIPYFIINEEHPDWKIMNNYHTWVTSSAISADSAPQSHPICCECNSPAEIESIFDDISYSKAAALIFMLMHHISMDKLRDTLRVFYKRFLYDCADTEDFIGALNEVTNDDLTSFIKYWTSETGYPLVTFDEDGALSQSRFTTSGLIDGQVWSIPLFLLRKKKGSSEIVEEKIMFTSKTMSISNLVEDSEWIKLNPGYRSFCRIWYRGNSLTRLLTPIKNKEIDAIDRWTILTDSLSIARANLMPYGEIISLLEAYSEEDEYMAATQIVGFISQLFGLFPALKSELQNYGKRILGGILNRIGKVSQKGESPDRSQLRASIFTSLAFSCNDEDIIQIGLNSFKYFKENNKMPEDVDPNLISFIIRCGGHFDNNATEFLWNVVKTELNPEIQCQACVALGNSPIEKIDEIMVKSLDVKKQDVIYFFAGFSINPDIGDRFYNFVKNTHQKIYEMFGGMAFNLPETFEYAAGGFITNEKADDLETFFKEHPAEVAEKSVKMIVERIRSKAKLVADQFESVKNALSH
ncbi:Clan MA, family M1, aminopeptidase N-like metallopeptidase [Tritrichomonas foetus]|uniref:Aminopeptidase n=1 Tax=Tritrichomonas foetus TaxID=1144522 RepID=A0A1J4JSU7_9EUKA|nr:Clan MA, family M1, aminopeptidase N-like metallopeptidase [Tritrichomonas foetus]|eukprot:OHT00349.1 Clan MA, family M1, aminopeptidase N-like metallopeptidase [Tritrichomonas foetus]